MAVKEALSSLLAGGSLLARVVDPTRLCGVVAALCAHQVIPSTYVNKAMERLVKNDVHFRFVIDIAGSLSPSSAEVDDL